MRAIPSCRDGQYLDTRNSKLTDEQIVKHIDMMQAIRRLHEQIVQWDRWNVRRRNAGMTLMRDVDGTNRDGPVWWIYAETDTSFEVSGVPLATAAKETGSLWGSVGTEAGVRVAAS
jgi:hypothetical protein